jgi:hypothetical protein
VGGYISIFSDGAHLNSDFIFLSCSYLGKASKRFINIIIIYTAGQNSRHIHMWHIIQHSNTFSSILFTMGAGRLSDLLYISSAVFAITDCLILGRGQWRSCGFLQIIAGLDISNSVHTPMYRTSDLLRLNIQHIRFSVRISGTAWRKQFLLVGPFASVSRQQVRRLVVSLRTTPFYCVRAGNGIFLVCKLLCNNMQYVIYV